MSLKIHGLRRPGRCNLLVVPHNLVEQWRKYIDEFYDDDHMPKTRIVVRGKTLQELSRGDWLLADQDLVVVTSSLYSRVVKLAEDKGVRFQRVIYDEVDSLHLPGCPRPDAAFYWIVTASYANLLHPRGSHRWDPVLRRLVYSASGIHNAGFIRSVFMDVTCAPIHTSVACSSSETARPSSGKPLTSPTPSCASWSAARRPTSASSATW